MSQQVLSMYIDTLHWSRGLVHWYVLGEHIMEHSWNNIIWQWKHL